jgi:homoserine kinase type II
MRPVLTTVASHFGLGDVLACEPITEGLMNPNWRLTTTTGDYAVKQLRDASPAAARRQQSVLPLLATRGLPVPSVVGDEVDGKYYLVGPWMPGGHRTGNSLPIDTCRALGDLVGRIHVALRELMPAPATLADRPRTVEAARAELVRFGRAAADGHEQFDRVAAADIGERLVLLDEVAHLRPADSLEAGPVGWTHGDLNDLNLLFEGDVVSGVLDWDRLGVRPYGLEVVRTVTLVFGVGDLGRTEAFAAGYRSRVDIGNDALRDAAHRRWWDLVTETWILRLHYDRGDSGCDHILPRSAALRRWWTDHRDEFDAALRPEFR